MYYKIISKGLVRNFCSEGIKFKHRKIRSPLVEVFNVKATKGSLDFSKRGGLFNVPELITPSGFSEIQKQCVVQTKKLIEEAQNAERTRKMVEIFDEMSDSLCRVADLAEFIRIAHPSPKFRAAAEDTCLSVSEIVEHLNTNRKLYDNLKESLTVGDVTATTEVDNLVGQLFLFDFEQNGIHLSEDQRNKVVMLNNAILNLGQRFVAGSDLPRIVKKSVIPSSVQGSFNSEGDNIIVSGLSVDSPNAMVREIAYKIYYYPDKQQALLLENLIQHRLELANICGFKSYAERVLRGGTIDNTSDVISFLQITSNDIKQFSNSDFKLMNKMKRADNFEEELAIWDVPYYVTKAKRNWFSVKQEEYCPYFSLGACMDGLNIIFENLYGISLVNCPVMEGECWSSDVYKLAVEHETEGTLGYIYCDFYERIGKPNQDCHFTIRGGKELNDGSYQVPIAVLLLNFRSPTWGTPSLLTPHNVDNLFHEMGHAMHSMLARTKYQHVTGTRCSTDFAEVPSVLMEYFASDPRIIKLFARHYETNAPIPKEMLQRLCASKKVFTACETKMQIFYSVLDQLFHSEDPYSKNVPEAVAAIQEQYYGLQYVPNTAWHLRFSHLVGYGAKYYSYLVSRSVAHSIWHNHFQSDPLNRTQGENYRRDCLAHGGGKNPKKLVADFLKIEPSPKVLANSLVTDISENYKEVEKCCYSHNI